METTGSPRFLGNPFANMPCSSTPADRMHQAAGDARRYCLPLQLTASAPRSVTFRGSITQPVRSLSTLRSSDCSDRTPRKTRFPLAANLGGTGLSPAGLRQEVSTLCFNSHRFLLLEALPGAPASVPRGGRHGWPARSSATGVSRTRTNDHVSGLWESASLHVGSIAIRLSTSHLAGQLTV